MASRLKLTTLVLGLIVLAVAVTACAKYPVVVNSAAPAPSASATTPPAR
jgi:hypothetical protein